MNLRTNDNELRSLSSEEIDAILAPASRSLSCWATVQPRAISAALDFL